MLLSDGKILVPAYYVSELRHRKSVLGAVGDCVVLGGELKTLCSQLLYQPLETQSVRGQPTKPELLGHPAADRPPRSRIDRCIQGAKAVSDKANRPCTKAG